MQPATEPNFIDILLKYLDPQPIMGMGYNVAWELLPIAYVIFALSILFRTVQEQYTAATQAEAMWAKYFMDIFLWGTLLTLYFFLSIPIIDFFNTMYALTEHNGSLSTITDQVALTIEKLNNIPADNSPFTDNLLSQLLDTGMGFLMYGGAWLLYLISFLIVLFVTSFLEICHAFLFNIAFIWGLFAIPLTITNNIKLLRPWAMGFGIILLWPVFESLLLFFFKGIFIGATTEMMQNLKHYSLATESSFYLAFAILNLIIVATVVVAPFFAQFFLTGSGLTAAIFTFVGSGLGAAKFAYDSVAKPTNVAGRAAGALGKHAQNTSFANAMGHIGQMLNNGGFTPGGGRTPGGGQSGGGARWSQAQQRGAQGWTHPRQSGQGNGYGFANGASTHNNGGQSPRRNGTQSGDTQSRYGASSQTTAPSPDSMVAQSAANAGNASQPHRLLNPSSAPFVDANVHNAHGGMDDIAAQDHDNNTVAGAIANQSKAKAPLKRSQKATRTGYFVNKNIQKSKTKG